MICSPLGAHAYQKALLENFYQNKVCDLSIASLQPYYNIYILKKPYVFQDRKYGGHQCTKIEAENCPYFKNKKIPEKMVFTNTIPIKTCYNK